jgi:hypothetical protein
MLNGSRHPEDGCSQTCGHDGDDDHSGSTHG